MMNSGCTNNLGFEVVSRFIAAAALCWLNVLPAYSTDKEEVGYAIITNEVPLARLENGSMRKILRSNLFRFVEGVATTVTQLGSQADFGIGGGKLAAVTVDPMVRKPVVTIWDYQSGAEEHQFGVFEIDAWLQQWVTPRNQIAISPDGATLWYVGLGDSPEQKYSLTQCDIASGICQIFDFPIPISRSGGLAITPYKEGALVCGQGAPSLEDVFYFESDSFVELSPNWRFEFPEMPVSEHHFVLSCVAVHGGIAHVAHNGYVHLLRQDGDLQINLTALDDPDQPAPDERIDRWVSPQIRVLDGTEMLFLGEASKAVAPSRLHNVSIKAVIALSTEDGALVERWPMQGEVVDFIVTPRGNIRFVDQAMTAIREYDTRAGTFHTIIEFPGDEVTNITLIPMP